MAGNPCIRMNSINTAVAHLGVLSSKQLYFSSHNATTKNKSPRQREWLGVVGFAS